MFGSISFPSVLALCEMQTVSFGICTQVAMSISNINYDITSTLQKERHFRKNMCLVWSQKIIFKNLWTQATISGNKFVINNNFSKFRISIYIYIYIYIYTCVCVCVKARLLNDYRRQKRNLWVEFKLRLYMAVCISLCSNALGKGMNLSLLLSRLCVDSMYFPNPSATSKWHKLVWIHSFLLLG